MADINPVSVGVKIQALRVDNTTLSILFLGGLTHSLILTCLYTFPWAREYQGLDVVLCTGIRRDSTGPHCKLNRLTRKC